MVVLGLLLEIAELLDFLHFARQYDTKIDSLVKSSKVQKKS